MDPDFVIKDEASLRDLFPPTHDLAKKKCLDHIDRHARAFIERSPFLCISTQSPDGMADVSPRGDPAGFVIVKDDATLLIPDRPGNNRLDTLSNIVANPSVGLLFMVPGFDETMRVNGTAMITHDPSILATMAMHDRLPRVAIVVKVNEVFIHCSKAFRRSKLWDPNRFQDRSGMASLTKIILDQTTGAPKDDAVLKKMEDDLEAEYQATMY